MEKAGGGISAQNLDTRLLRFRNRPESEDGASLAEQLLAAGRAAEALEVVHAAKSSAPEDPTLLLVEGQAYLRSNDLIRSQAALLKAARVAPRDKEPFRWLGEVLLKRGDPQRAEKVLERALAIDSQDRAIQLLHQRAQRFARIAADEGTETAAQVSRQSFERPEVEDDPATVVAPDVSERLAGTAGPPGETRVERDPPEASGQTTVDRHPDAFGEDDEDVPTTVADRSEMLAEIEALPTRNASAPVAPPPRKRSPKATMLGVGAVSPEPRKPPAPPAPPKPAAVPPPAAMPPKRAPKPRAKRTMLGMGAKPAAGPPKPDVDFGTDPFAEDPFGDEVTTDARREPVPERRLDRISDPVPAAPRRPSEPAPSDLEARAPQPPMPLAPPPRPPEPGLDDLDSIPSAEVESLDSLSSDLGFGADLGDDEGYDELEDEPTRNAPDAVLGDEVGRQEDVDGVLRMLEREGIFEAPSGQQAQWAEKKEVQRSGQRIGRVLVVAWVVAVLLAVGGWFGWQEWVKHRHAESARLTEDAEAAAFAGDHADLVDAERNLRQARDLDPHAKRVPSTLVFVHSQRSLEDGAFEPGYLRPAIRRGERMEVDEGRLKAALAVLAAAEGEMDTARDNIRMALEASPEDPAVLYLAGRVKQRLGEDDALESLEKAVEAAPKLSAAAIALAEARVDEGRRDEALELLDRVLEHHPGHLRATLWKTFVTADEADPDEALARVNELEERLDVGAPPDRVLTELTRARLLRRKGEVEPAAEAVDRAGEAGATEPRLLALVANEAQAVGRLALAQATATNAVAGAPSNADFRKLLADILLERRDGVRALRTLGALDMEDPDVLEMSAEAALLVGTQEALAAAAEALGSYLEETEEPGVEMRALQIRTAVALGQGADVLRPARQLAEDAPGDPLAALALGEAALAAREPRIAKDALQRLVQAAPEDAEGHYLLGRAYRLAGEPEEAERSFRRAIEILPEHTDARLALGRLLLDQGKFAEADELYQELARRGGIASGAATALLGRLGRVEALLGLGRVEDAAVQFESVREQDREAPVARVAAAQLALAQNRPGEAVSALRPIVDAESPPADIVAMYGDALFAAGEIDPAHAQYNRALEIDGGSPEALLGKAKVAVRAENTRDAANYLEQVQESLEYRVRPPRLTALMHFLRGRSKMQEGRGSRDAARSALRQSVETEGAPVEAWFWLGEALSGENAPDAREAYERYLELAPEGEYAARARRAIR